MTKCIECGSTKKVYSKQFGVPLCPNCTRMWKAHPQHELPNVGEIKYDDLGRPICHICGRAFDKLLTHVKQRHKMSPEEYKAKFELESGAGLISDKVRDVTRQNVINNYEKVVVENLLKNGTATRFQKGDVGRTKDKLRLQTKIKLANHIQNIGPNKK